MAATIRDESHTTFISLVLFAVIWDVWDEIEMKLTTNDCSGIYIYIYIYIYMEGTVA